MTSEELIAATGRRIRKLRKAQRLSIEALGEASGLHATHLGGLERGKHNPSLSTLAKIAKVLSVSVATLVEAEFDQTDVKLRHELAVRAKSVSGSELRRLLRVLDAIRE